MIGLFELWWVGSRESQYDCLHCSHNFSPSLPLPRPPASLLPPAPQPPQQRPMFQKFFLQRGFIDIEQKGMKSTAVNQKLQVLSSITTYQVNSSPIWRRWKMSRHRLPHCDQKLLWYPDPPCQLAAWFGSILESWRDHLGLRGRWRYWWCAARRLFFCPPLSWTHLMPLWRGLTSPGPITWRHQTEDLSGFELRPNVWFLWNKVSFSALLEVIQHFWLGFTMTTFTFKSLEHLVDDNIPKPDLLHVQQVECTSCSTCLGIELQPLQTKQDITSIMMISPAQTAVWVTFCGFSIAHCCSSCSRELKGNCLLPWDAHVVYNSQSSSSPNQF